MAFSSLYNATRIAEVIAGAREFLDVATTALERKQLRAFTDNIFSAVEMLAKAQLLSSPTEALMGKVKNADPRLVGRTHHEEIGGAFARWAELGNTDLRYVELYQQLKSRRNPARYLLDHLDLDADAAASMLRLAEEMYHDITARAPKLPAS